MSTSDVRVTMTLVDRFTPELHRARWHFLRPINHGLPPRGSLARDMMLAQSRLRRAGRELAKALPGGTAVPWTEVGRTWWRWLVRAGYIYCALVIVIFLAHWAGIV